MIRFTRVTKTYPRTGTAVQDVSLTVNKGEFVLLTGASGAGKTSLLKMVYLEERPTSGEVRVAGTSSVTATARDVAKLRRKLGIVFQDFRLLENRTVEQNVSFALEVIGAPTGRDRRQGQSGADAGRPGIQGPRVPARAVGG
jgi:cell division transport system ATP-binding protein